MPRGYYRFLNGNDKYSKKSVELEVLASIRSTCGINLTAHTEDNFRRKRLKWGQITFTVKEYNIM